MDEFNAYHSPHPPNDIIDHGGGFGGGECPSFDVPRRAYDRDYDAPRRRTLKARIRRQMAGHAFSANADLGRVESTTTTTTTTETFRSAQNRRRSPVSKRGRRRRSQSAEPPSMAGIFPPFPPFDLAAALAEPRLTSSTSLGMMVPSSSSPVAAAAVREEEVLDAASALASLGVTSPATTIHGTTVEGRSDGRLLFEGHNATEEERDSDYSSTWMIRPPPIVAAASSSSPPPSAGVQPSPTLPPALPSSSDGPGAASRPFAALLGTDVPLTFPQKLMEMLSNADLESVVTWLPHGKGFIILQKRRFALDVMPLYFKHSKFTSFTRKLNRWGFSRVSRGPEMGAYYHKFFQRNNYLLCMQMHCQSNNKSASKDSDDAAKSPKRNAKKSPTTPPLPIETSSNNANPAAMSPLALDADSDSMDTSPSPAASHMPSTIDCNGDDDGSAPLPRTFDGSVATSSGPIRMSPISEGNTALENSFTSSFAAPEQPSGASTLGHGEMLAKYGHRRQERCYQNGIDAAGNTGPFDRTYSRQQEILMANDVNPCQEGSAMQSSYGAQQQQQQMQHQIPARLQSSPMVHQRRSTAHSARPNVDQSIAIQKFLGVDTSSSRNHPLVIGNALKALKSSNDQALLRTLSSMGRANSEIGGGTTTTTTTVPQPVGETSYRERSIIHAAMQAQLRRLDEGRDGDRHHGHRGNGTTKTSASCSALKAAAIRRGIESAHAAVMSSSSAGMRGDIGSSQDAPLHGAMLARMRQLDSELRAQRAIIARGSARGAGKKKETDLQGKTRTGSPMSQRKIAQLYNEINSRQRREMTGDAAGGGALGVANGLSRPGGVGDRRSDRSWRSVRRASAA